MRTENPRPFRTDGPVTTCRPFRGTGDDTDMMSHAGVVVTVVMVVYVQRAYS
jgi:hypothetical protein